MRYILILGTNTRALQFADSIESRPELGYRILGFVDQQWPQLESFIANGRPLVADLSTLPEFLRHNVVDEVANYLPLRSFYEHASQVAALCELHGIILRFDSDIFGLKRSQSESDVLTGDHHITCYPGMGRALPLMVKRVIDFTGALIALSLLAPVLAVAALLVKFTSEGTGVFLPGKSWLQQATLPYLQIPHHGARRGENDERPGKAERSFGPVFKIKDDPRITPIGKVLRRTSIDELPQLINVLKGDMSLVGPRPLPVRDYNGFQRRLAAPALQRSPGNHLPLAGERTQFHHVRTVDETRPAIHGRVVSLARY